MSKIHFLVSLLFFGSFLPGCYPIAGPDKSIAGGVLGAGWGAGAGVIIGNQIGETGPGIAIGSGLGLVAGTMTGIGLDMAEGTEFERQRELDALRIQVAANHHALANVRAVLDDRVSAINSISVGTQVFFDQNRASLRYGSATQLERFVDQVKQNPFVRAIEVHGHSDDTGDIALNERLSEARARTVAGFLLNHGISSNLINTFNHGSTQPLASNSTDAGRYFNRRVEVVLIK